MPSLVPDSLKVERDLEDLEKRSFDHRSMLKEASEAKKNRVDNVNAFIVVGAFIAGVQSQSLAGTTAFNATRLQDFTNGLGFVGLTLDIIGTSLGVVHALYLQKAIRITQQLLQTLDIEPLKNKIQHLRKTQASHEQIMVLIRGHQEKIEFLPSLPSARSQVFLGHNVAPQYLSELPLVAMSLGIACLLASVICYAAYSQPRAVWITCTVITAPSAGYLVVMMVRNKTSARERNQFRRFSGA